MFAFLFKGLTRHSSLSRLTCHLYYIAPKKKTKLRKVYIDMKASDKTLLLFFFFYFS